jgi:hypothetical protein
MHMTYAFVSVVPKMFCYEYIFKRVLLMFCELIMVRISNIYDF